MQAVAAQVILPSLEQRDVNRTTYGSGHGRQIFVEKLVLQRPRSGRNDDSPARHQDRHEISECLAYPCSGLNNQHIGFSNCLRNPLNRPQANDRL